MESEIPRAGGVCTSWLQPQNPVQEPLPCTHVCISSNPQQHAAKLRIPNPRIVTSCALLSAGRESPPICPIVCQGSKYQNNSHIFTYNMHCEIFFINCKSYALEKNKTESILLNDRSQSEKSTYYMTQIV